MEPDSVVQQILAPEIKLPDTTVAPQEGATLKEAPKGDSPEAPKDVDGDTKVAAAAAAKEVRERAHRMAQVFKAKRLEKDRLRSVRTDTEKQRDLYRTEEGRYRSLAQAAKEDPLSFLESHGVTAEAVAERVIKRGEKATPDQEAARFAAEARKIAEELRKELEEEKSARARERQEALAAKAKADHEGWARQLVSTVHDKAKYPSAAALYPTDRAVYKAAEELAEEAMEKGLKRGYTRDRLESELNALSHAEVADLLNQRASLRIRAATATETPKTEEGKAVGLGTSVPNAATAEATPKPVPSRMSGPAPRSTPEPGKTRTLTNEGASKKASGKVPVDQLPEAEQNRLLAEEYRRMTAAKAKTA
jgi:uncharacterized Zn finger protein